MQFVFDRIREIMRGKELGKRVMLWGNGHQKREPMLVDDFVRILWELRLKFDNEIFKLGAGEDFSVRTFVEKICRIVGYPPKNISNDTSRHVDAASKCLNAAKMKAALPAHKLQPLDLGLKRIIQWFYQSGAYPSLTITDGGARRESSSCFD
jgi:nucleoside-diphosphate-sugar epimerase